MAPFSCCITESWALAMLFVNLWRGVTCWVNTGHFCRNLIFHNNILKCTRQKNSCQIYTHFHCFAMCTEINIESTYFAYSWKYLCCTWAANISWALGAYLRCSRNKVTSCFQVEMAMYGRVQGKHCTFLDDQFMLSE